MRRKNGYLPTHWLPDQSAVISPDHKHAYVHTACWDPTAPQLGFVLLHPLPNSTVVERCKKIAQSSKFGGMTIRYLFTLITSNQEELVDSRSPNAPFADHYLAGIAEEATTDRKPQFDLVMAAWKLRGGTKELKSAVAQRVREVATTDIDFHTPDPEGAAVLSPTQFPDNIVIDGYERLRYTHERAATWRLPAPRVLMTGSRTWSDTRSVGTSLEWAWRQLGSRPDTVLIEGECPLGGADLEARTYWEHEMGLPVEPHPADTSPTGQLLGPERNARMVASGAQLCLGYPNNGSRGGTRDCLQRASQADIPIVLVKEGTVR